MDSYDQEYLWNRLMKTAKSSTEKMQEHLQSKSEFAVNAIQEIEGVKNASASVGRLLGSDVGADEKALSMLAERLDRDVAKKEDQPES
ncbi:hypothetical protein D9M68_853190 [compost metagenome]